MPAVRNGAGKIAPFRCDIRDNDPRRFVKVGDDKSIFDVVEDISGISDNGLCGAKDFSRQGIGDIDKVVELPTTS